MEHLAKHYEVIVIGGGHVDTLLCCLGCKPCILISGGGDLPCNPSIGGTSKGIWFAN